MLLVLCPGCRQGELGNDSVTGGGATVAGCRVCGSRYVVELRAASLYGVPVEALTVAELRARARGG